MGAGLRPGAKAPDKPPNPYRLRASPRLYTNVVGTLPSTAVAAAWPTSPATQRNAPRARLGDRRGRIGGDGLGRPGRPRRDPRAAVAGSAMAAAPSARGRRNIPAVVRARSRTTVQPVGHGHRSDGAVRAVRATPCHPAHDAIADEPRYR